MVSGFNHVVELELTLNVCKRYLLLLSVKGNFVSVLKEIKLKKKKKLPSSKLEITKDQM